MWGWLVKNKEWVFDGFGVTVVLGFLGLGRKFLWSFLRGFFQAFAVEAGPAATRDLSRQKNEPLPAAVVNNVTQRPTITFAPNITILPQGANADMTREEPAASSPTPVKAPPNLKLEAIKLGQIFLQGDFWTLNPVPLPRGQQHPHWALLIDITNVPTHSGNIGVATVKGVFKIASQTYSPLAWLEEPRNEVRLGPADRKTVVLAVCNDPTTPWRLVLNHRSNLNYTAPRPSQMDVSNLAPLMPDQIAELQLVDIHTGELLFKHYFVWSFDLNSNRPVLLNDDGLKDADRARLLGSLPGSPRSVSGFLRDLSGVKKTKDGE